MTTFIKHKFAGQYIIAKNIKFWLYCKFKSNKMRCLFFALSLYGIYILPCCNVSAVTTADQVTDELIGKSKLSKSLHELGFTDIVLNICREGESCVQKKTTAKERQIALISILHSLGALDKNVVKHGIMNLEPKYGKAEKGPSNAYKQFCKVNLGLKKNKSHDSNELYEYILNNLFRSRVFSQQDVTKIALYLIRWASIAKPLEDKKIKIKTKSKFLKNLFKDARTIGLIDPIVPNHYNKNDTIFISGGIREDIDSKLQYLQELCCDNSAYNNTIHTFNNVILPNSCRRAMCDKDGIDIGHANKQQECMNYLTKLARQNKIKPISANLFILYQDTEGNKTNHLMFNDNGELNEMLIMSNTYQNIIGKTPYTTANINCATIYNQQKYYGWTDTDVMYIYKTMKNNKQRNLLMLDRQPFAIANAIAMQNALNNLYNKNLYNRILNKNDNFYVSILGSNLNSKLTEEEVVKNTLMSIWAIGKESYLTETYNSYARKLGNKDKSLEQITKIAKSYTVKQ
ncbi:MAG: hypothetical protein JJW01_01850 [Alphaproteobacteria bacterium]|nr:hypothetical protein [Rickettsiales bacterium]